MSNLIGGQAVIEGVMMRSDSKYSIAVRKPNKKISIKIAKLKGHWSYNIPILRGISRFIETIVIGIKGLNYSASESAGEKEKLSNWDMVLTIILSIIITITLFYMAPLFLARLVTGQDGVWFNILDGILRILIFLGYLFFISLFPDIRRIFQYHGAEHMTVHCHEHKEKLTEKNISKYSTLHPRCGTNFILIVFLLSIFFFSFIQVDGFLNRLTARLFMLPLIAGFSYEFLKYSGKNIDSPWVKFCIYPGLMLQKITTRKPEKEMITVAKKALQAIL